MLTRNLNKQQEAKEPCENAVRDKPLKKVKRCISFFLKLIPLIVVAPFTLPYIYTSPALTPKNLAIYNRYIQFLKDHDEHRTFQLNEFGWIHTGHDFYILDSPNSIKKLRGVFSEEDIYEIRELSKKLHSINCNTALRQNDIVLFIKNIIPVLPKSFGTLYSLDGRNPNEIDSQVLNAYKPFIRIGGNWYMSRCLVRQVRFIVPVSIPKKSLFNHSLRTKGLNLGDTDGN